ncbi:FMN-dependent NADH-azoreductase [Roseibium denhamense]|uniref:FMN dependent NADH:quinone oxidoreductase n=1 Tax=Roseibium denhamense TaxID=76305 RepID=A0ABY1NBD3_9HYPH|nr:NAD(P)H-dependent oxidoreductase [Roseibium denhamense]MTI06602.1 FMN-dependent NADH-azoreductase [Roseibium denhamense]SMP05637.1 FMN-dependent NADH-azoreductase [Roseibium denhamense]
MTASAKTILQIDASARKAGSVTRELADALVTRLIEQTPDASILKRDVSQGLPFLDEDWINANFTDAADRTPEQKLKLALSDTLVSELKAADTIVIGSPIYNFSVPAALKAWVDLIARARLTFQYTENGPVGLLEGKTAYIVVASGGTKAGSEIDYASTYMKHVLGFIGITDVRVIAADQLMMTPENRDTALAQTRDLAA